MMEMSDCLCEVYWEEEGDNEHKVRVWQLVSVSPRPEPWIEFVP